MKKYLLLVAILATAMNCVDEPPPPDPVGPSCDARAVLDACQDYTTTTFNNTIVEADMKTNCINNGGTWSATKECPSTAALVGICKCDKATVGYDVQTYYYSPTYDAIWAEFSCTLVCNGTFTAK